MSLPSGSSVTPAFSEVKPVLPGSPGIHQNLAVLNKLCTVANRDAAMKRLFALVFGVGLGALAMFGAFHLHVVRADSGWHFVRKQKIEIADCIADVREWDADDWKDHPELARNLEKAGKGDLVKQPTPEDLFRDAIDAWRNARRPNSPTRQ